MRRLISMHRVVSFVALSLGVLPCVGQTTYVPEAGEYAVAGNLPGDQDRPCLALGSSWGLAVWQDNATDGDGLGISAVRLDGNLSSVFSPFRVNSEGADNQEAPRACLLPNGGAAFVWQGGPQGKEQIHARFMASDYTWASDDVPVGDSSGDFDIAPDIAARYNSSVIVTWSRYDQSGSNGYDVFARRLSSVGTPVGDEFRVNETTALNQASPKVTVLSDGTTSVVVWVSEGQRRPGSSDIYARKFGLRGLPLTGEILVNSSSNVCVHPSVTAADNGGFMVAWEEKSLTAPATDSRDIFVRAFDEAGTGGTVHRANGTVYGDQYEPTIAKQGSDYLAVWTSLGQDGSREGVYGRFLNWAGSPVGSEFLVNSMTGGMQIHPTVQAGASNRFLVAWSTYVGSNTRFDLKAQRYAPFAEPLTAPDAPFVSPVSTTSLAVTWPAQQGFEVASYKLYLDGASSPAAVVTNTWCTLSGLTANHTYSIRLAYALTDGRSSPLSSPASGTTYGAYGTTPYFGQIPYDWMVANFGEAFWLWPTDLSADTDHDGGSLSNEFLAGTDPLDPNSVLKMYLSRTLQGLFLSWNTVPAQIYQVQTSSNGTSWTNLGLPRFAAGDVDSLWVGSTSTGFFRVVRVR